MSFQIKQILKISAFTLAFFSLSYASEVSSDITFSLPADLTKWQEASNQLMEPVLTTQELKDTWQAFVDDTLPTHGNFITGDPARRAHNILLTYKTMIPLDDAGRLTYLTKLIERHQTIYLQKK